MSLGDPNSKATQDAFDKWFASISDEDNAEIKTILSKATKSSPRKLKMEQHIYEGWLTFKKVLKNFEMKNYLFRVTPLPSPDACDLILINVPETISVLTKHYEIFKQATGMEFEPIKVVLEAEDPDSLFWKRVFAMENHLAKGLLYGFGLKNSLSFNSTYEISTDDPSIKTGKGSLTNFRIPLFGVAPGDKTAEKYREEKKIIEQIYRNQDMIQVTLQRLANH